MLKRGDYFVLNDKLYCVITVGENKGQYYIENCETLFKHWLSAHQLKEAKRVTTKAV